MTNSKNQKQLVILADILSCIPEHQTPESLASYNVGEVVYAKRFAEGGFLFEATQSKLLLLLDCLRTFTSILYLGGVRFVRISVNGQTCGNGGEEIPMVRKKNVYRGLDEVVLAEIRKLGYGEFSSSEKITVLVLVEDFLEVEENTLIYRMVLKTV